MHRITSYCNKSLKYWLIPLDHHRIYAWNFCCFPAHLYYKSRKKFSCTYVRQVTGDLRDVGSIPWRGVWQSIPLFLPGEPHG